MHRGRATLLAVGVLLMLGTAIALAPAVVAQEDEESSESEAGFGAQVSTFMQSTAADAESDVNRDMWEATVTKAESPSAVIGDRAGQLERQLRSLEEQSETLQAQRDQGDVSGVAYAARASQVRVRIANLRDSIDSAATQAANHGVDPGRLSELQEGASELEGPEIAAIARTITDAGENAREGQGPPGDGRGSGAPDGSGDGDQAGNGPDGEAGGAPGHNNGNGPDGEPGEGGSDDGDTGPPDSAPSDGETGPPDSAPNDGGANDDGEAPSDRGSGPEGPPDDPGPNPPQNPPINPPN